MLMAHAIEKEVPMVAGKEALAVSFSRSLSLSNFF
jgi:hypothetical protein